MSEEHHDNDGNLLLDHPFESTAQLRVCGGSRQQSHDFLSLAGPARVAFVA